MLLAFNLFYRYLCSENIYIHATTAILRITISLILTYFGSMIFICTEPSSFHKLQVMELVETFQGFASILSDWPNTNKLVEHKSKIKVMLHRGFILFYLIFALIEIHLNGFRILSSLE